MAAGLRSTKTTTEWSSSTFHSRTTTPCWIRRRWTSQGGFSKCWRRRAEYAITDRLGDHGITGSQRHTQRLRGERNRLPAAHAKERWMLGRTLLHRNRLPARVLSDVPHVSPIFPAHRADDV